MENLENQVANQTQPKLEPVDSETKKQAMKLFNSLLLDIDKNFEELAWWIQIIDDTQKEVESEMNAYETANPLMDVDSAEYKKYLQFQADRSFLSRIKDMIYDRVSEKVTEEQYDQFLQLVETRPDMSHNQEVPQHLESELSAEMELPDVEVSSNQIEVPEVHSDSVVRTPLTDTNAPATAQISESKFQDEELSALFKQGIVHEGSGYRDKDGILWISEEEYLNFLREQNDSFENVELDEYGNGSTGKRI